MYRENGYYWINFHGTEQIAEYRDGNWFLIGFSYPVYESELQEINETRIINPKQV